jgi:hypothetical protein
MARPPGPGINPGKEWGEFAGYIFPHPFTGEGDREAVEGEC